jgi:very-short-patch-repair endonuclease
MVDSISNHLEKSRQSLLDLSARNRLLNIPKRASSKIINIYDELTPEIYRLLVTDGKSMSFLPGQLKQNQKDSESLENDDENGVYLPQPEDDGERRNGLASRHTDLKLQTKLASDKLQHRLLEMYYDAKTFIEEQGVNILYLALGQLKWYDTDSSDKERVAPLILLPVALERKSAAERFYLKWLQDDASENLSLAAKLKADFGIVLPEFKVGDDFDPEVYILEVTKSVSSQQRWEVIPNAMVLGFFSFAKFLMYRDLDVTIWPEKNAIHQHSIIKAALEDGFPAKEELFPENIHLDNLISVADQKHVVDADSSQSLAIEAVRTGQNLVIQGPPGTGKSQTITNVIASAIVEGKKVLFVSEKMAALEVVYRRLQNIGLGPACIELHSNRTNKRRVLEDIKASKELGRPLLDNRDRLVDDLETSRKVLNSHAESMHVKSQPSLLSAYTVIGHLSRLENISLVGLPMLIESHETWSPIDFDTRKNVLKDFCSKAEKVGNPKKHPWRGVRLKAVLKLDVEYLVDAVNKFYIQSEALREVSAKLANGLGVQVAENLKDLKVQFAVSEEIAKAPELDRAAIANTVWDNGILRLNELVNSGKNFTEGYQALSKSFVESAWKEDIEICRRNIAASGNSIFRIFNSDYRRSIRVVKSHSKANLPSAYGDKLSLLDNLLTSQALRKKLLEQDQVGSSAFGHLWRGEQSNWQQLSLVMQWMEGSDGKGLSDSFRHLYSQISSPKQCIQIAKQLSEDAKKWKDEFNALIEKTELDLEEAFLVEDVEKINFQLIVNRLNEWNQESTTIYDWVQYGSIRLKAKDLGMGVLIKQYEEDKIPLENLFLVLERSYYETILRKLSQENPQLAVFNGQKHDELVNQFRILDNRRLDLARAETALAHFENIPRGTAGIGPMGVLNGEIARKRGHMPLRKLFRMAGEAVQAIKPVFMMSPLSVAQFLEPGAIEFDLLVIDEASQIEPVDALGSIARCKQLVVVGDDRQLPPTRFFSRMTNDVTADEEDDEASIAGASDVESVLSLCLAKGMPQLMLRWHYRSRHQSLIAVSNQQFYESRLFIVPSPYTVASGKGLKFNHITNGTFDTGGTRVNQEEARAVARAVIEHARNNPKLSLGVATFSLKQKIAIQDELELLRRESPETEIFFNSHGEEPFFIKNLENVQGDERDVIFISVAYARNKSGYLAMRFGPVGADGGERRLNVLISRAKQRCEVFSSITSEDIDLDRVTGKGVVALKIFLNYAATGQLAIASRSDREIDSPLEEEIKRALEAEGLTVHPQIGIAGFYIDLAISDPENSGRYLLGIECDGASYHSTRSARDRDRLRQAVLEDHGWILHRVWSADWFQNPKKELRRLIAALEAAKLELIARQENNDQNIKDSYLQITAVDRDNEVIASFELKPNFVESYTESNFSVPIHQELHNIPLFQLSQIIHQIVDVEGPIHFDEVVTRIRSLWGLQKAGNRIREVLEKAQKILLSENKISQAGLFADIVNRKVRIRDRSNVDSTNLRKPNYLPPLEIQAAIKEVLQHNLGGHIDELPQAISRTLGFSTMSSQLKEIILNELSALVEAKKVERTDQIYRVTA